MIIRSLVRSAPVALLALVAASAARAQTCTNAGAASATCNVTATATATVQHVVSLDIGSTSLALTGITGIGDYAVGTGIATLTNLNLQSVVVRANRSWILSVKANAAAWTFAAAGGTTDPAKPAGDLKWSTDGSTYTALTTSNVTLQTGVATNGSAPQSLSYRTSWDITRDVPGTYQMPVMFTLAAP